MRVLTVNQLRQQVQLEYNMSYLYPQLVDASLAELDKGNTQMAQVLATLAVSQNTHRTCEVDIVSGM
jgi:ferritin